MNLATDDTDLHALARVQFAELPQADHINRALLRAYLREKDAPGVRRSHHFAGRFENTYIDAQRLPELLPVSRFAARAAQRVLDCADLKHGFWFNEMAPGQHTSLHSHEELDELLSAVYYVTCPTGSGRLILHDEDAQIIVSPRAGLLVLFPPDLPHEVERNTSPAARLSVAFNFGPADSAS